MKPKQINVLVVEPKTEPYVKTIDNTLRAQQNIVNGYIEPIDLSYDMRTGRKVSFCVNEEGKMNDLPTNRIMIIMMEANKAYMDEIKGTFYVNAWDRHGDSVGLTEEEIQEFTQYFRPFAFHLKN